MATLRQSIDIDQPIETTSLTWAHFVKWVLVGHYRFVCDALTCARAIDSEVASFQRLDASRTRLLVELDYDELAGGDPEQRRVALNAHLMQDLERFKEFAEPAATGRGVTTSAPHAVVAAGQQHPDPPAETQHTKEDTNRPRFIA